MIESNDATIDSNDPAIDRNDATIDRNDAAGQLAATNHPRRFVHLASIGWVESRNEVLNLRIEYFSQVVYFARCPANGWGRKCR